MASAQSWGKSAQDSSTPVSPTLFVRCAMLPSSSLLNFEFDRPLGESMNDARSQKVPGSRSLPKPCSLQRQAAARRRATTAWSLGHRHQDRHRRAHRGSRAGVRIIVSLVPSARTNCCADLIFRVRLERSCPFFKFDIGSNFGDVFEAKESTQPHGPVLARVDMLTNRVPATACGARGS